jgi:hypothetical protein
LAFEARFRQRRAEERVDQMVGDADVVAHAL